MCGTLKLEGELKSRPIGSEIPSTHIVGPAKKNSYKWDGFARSDGATNGSKTMTEQWSSTDWKPVLINATQFTERGKDGKEHPFGMVSRKGTRHFIAALVRDTDSETGTLKIITKPANETVGKVHHRMPVTVPESMGRDGFVEFLNQRLEANYC